jgi:hypothetical protein
VPALSCSLGAADLVKEESSPLWMSMMVDDLAGRKRNRCQYKGRVASKREEGMIRFSPLESTSIESIKFIQFHHG